MFGKVLECLVCNHRFNYDHTGDDFPEYITCPSCHNNSRASDFSALTFCPQCRTKLKIPLDIISDDSLSCPDCGTMLNASGVFADETAAAIINGSGVGDGMECHQQPKRMLQDGEMFDKYMIISLLGRGGMAEVYLAEHLLLKQLCAVKLMRPGDGSDSNMAAKRFLREAKVLHQLNHPNIVKVFDVGSDSQTGYLFIAMEYVEGRTLHDLVQEKTFTEDELCKVLVSMANALTVLTEARVVHRDIKPSNIMLSNEGVYKLMDLGIAKSDNSSQIAGEVTLTLEQSAIGTPNYASPEQCRSAHNVDHRSDIYSLGATLYHLASGKMPFTGANAVETILNVMQTEAVPLKNYRPDLSDKMLNLIESMMQKNPVERPQLPDALLAAVYSRSKQRFFSNRAVPGAQLLKKCWKAAIVVILLILTAINFVYLSKHNRKSKPPAAATQTKILPQAESCLFTNMHPLMAYPDEIGNANADESDKVFTLVTLADPPEKVESVEYDKNSNMRNEVVLKNALNSFAVSLIFGSANEGHTGVLKIGDEINLLVYKNKIALLTNKAHFISTPLTVPAGHWAALTVSCDSDKRKLAVLSGNRLIGAYLLPEKIAPVKQISWGVELKTCRGPQLGRITVYNRALNITVKPELQKQTAIVNPSQAAVIAEVNAVTPALPETVHPGVKNAEKIVLRNDLNKLYLQCRSNVKETFPRWKQLGVRLNACRRKLEKLLAAESEDPLHADKVELRRQQIKTLEQQMEIRAKIDEAACRRYDEAKTVQFKKEFEAYLKSSGGRSVHFLCDKLKDPEVNPNVMLNIPEYCDKPLSLWSVAFLKLDDPCRTVLVETLKKRYADPDRAQAVSLPADVLAFGKHNIEFFIKLKFKNYFREIKNTKYIFDILSLQSNRGGIGCIYSAEDFKKYIMLAPGLEAKNIVDEYGRNAMHYAVMHDDPEIAKLLLAADFPDGKKPDNAGITPWRMALHFGSRKMVEFMQKHHLTTAEKTIDKLQYKLRTSYADKDYESAKQCLRDGADPYAPNFKLLSLLEEACAEKNIEFVRFLLDNGMNPDNNAWKFKTFRYTPAWFVALRRSSPEILDLVLEKLLKYAPRKSLAIAVLREFSLELVNKLIQNVDAMVEVLKKNFYGKFDLKDCNFRNIYTGGNFKIIEWERSDHETMKNWMVYLDLLFDLGVKVKLSTSYELQPAYLFEFVQDCYRKYQEKAPLAQPQ